MAHPYLFTSDRLGFRPWTQEDLPALHAITSDPQVMQYFPAVATPEQTLGLIQRMQGMQARKGYCYFATEQLEDHQLIGFIGLAEQIYAADFTPCVDIGWRLAPSAWGKGLATEGAQQCLDYGFKEIGLPEIVSVAPLINAPSIRVMQKIGMSWVKNFRHPALGDYPQLVECVLYAIDNK